LETLFAILFKYNQKGYTMQAKSSKALDCATKKVNQIVNFSAPVEIVRRGKAIGIKQSDIFTIGVETAEIELKKRLKTSGV
jgi:hypothetical protein